MKWLFVGIVVMGLIGQQVDRNRKRAGLPPTGTWPRAVPPDVRRPHTKRQAKHPALLSTAAAAPKTKPEAAP